MHNNALVEGIDSEKLIYLDSPADRFERAFKGLPPDNFKRYVNHGFLRLFSPEAYVRNWDQGRFICMGFNDDPLHAMLADHLLGKGYINYRQGLEEAIGYLKTSKTAKKFTRAFPGWETLDFDSLEDEGHFYVMAAIAVINEQPNIFSQITYLVPEWPCYGDFVTIHEFEYLLEYIRRPKKPINLIFR